MAEVVEPAAFALMPGTQEQLAKFGLEIIETAERERLEQAVLKAWEHEDEDGTIICYVCGAERWSPWRSPPLEHAEDCLVLALIAKHETP